MYTQIHHPELVPPEDLDRYLKDGWYRIGQAMVSCRFVWSQDGRLRSAIWTRTRLEGYRFRRSHRKLNNRNRRRFTVTHGPLVVDAEREDLYTRYRAHARGSRPPTLRQALDGDSDADLFDTRQISIVDDDGRLVAFCAYDVGNESLQSLIGVYDPDWAKHSLGFWTLLLEVEHAIELGLKYHYAGYVLPGEPSMDYKLRIGAMEFLHPVHAEWRPWEDFADVDLPSDRLDRALHRVRIALASQDVRTRMVSYRYYEAPVWSPTLRDGLDQPRVVVVAPRDKASADLIVTYDLDLERYRILRCLRAEGRTPGDDTEPSRRVALWIVHKELGTGTDARGVAAHAARLASVGV